MTGLTAGDYTLTFRAAPVAQYADVVPQSQTVTYTAGRSTIENVSFVQYPLPSDITLRGPGFRGVTSGGLAILWAGHDVPALKDLSHHTDPDPANDMYCVGASTDLADTNVQIFDSSSTLVAGPLPVVEGPLGHYSWTIPALPGGMTYTEVITIACGDPVGAVRVENNTIYIDPSGTVTDAAGNPVVGVNVTLQRFDASTGAFVAVPNGSLVMSPANRVNPGTTDSLGRFGWDVSAGLYKVHAEKAGCEARRTRRCWRSRRR